MQRAPSPTPRKPQPPFPLCGAGTQRGLLQENSRHQGLGREGGQGRVVGGSAWSCPSQPRRANGPGQDPERRGPGSPRPKVAASPQLWAPAHGAQPWGGGCCGPGNTGGLWGWPWVQWTEMACRHPRVGRAGQQGEPALVRLGWAAGPPGSQIDNNQDRVCEQTPLITTLPGQTPPGVFWNGPDGGCRPGSQWGPVPWSSVCGWAASPARGEHGSWTRVLITGAGARPGLGPW